MNRATVIAWTLIVALLGVTAFLTWQVIDLRSELSDGIESVEDDLEYLEGKVEYDWSVLDDLSTDVVKQEIELSRKIDDVESSVVRVQRSITILATCVESLAQRVLSRSGDIYC